MLISNGDQSGQSLLKTADQIARKGGREVDGELAELDPSNDKSGGQVRIVGIGSRYVAGQHSENVKIALTF